jgi:hypothetical protein
MNNLFKIIAMLLAIYVVILLSVIAFNSGVGRYQFKHTDARLILDTKELKLYTIDDNGKIVELDKYIKSGGR